MKTICLLIVLTHLAFPAFENVFPFQYLDSNLPNNWETVTGRPATGFGKTSNEKGILISVRKTMYKFTIYGWADMYWEVQNKFSFPVRSGDDFLTGFLYRKKGTVTLELKARRKTIVELFNNNSIYNLQKNMKYYYTFTMKKMIVLK